MASLNEACTIHETCEVIALVETMPKPGERTTQLREVLTGGHEIGAGSFTKLRQLAENRRHVSERAARGHEAREFLLESSTVIVHEANGVDSPPGRSVATLTNFFECPTELIETGRRNEWQRAPPRGHASRSGCASTMV